MTCWAYRPIASSKFLRAVLIGRCQSPSRTVRTNADPQLEGWIGVTDDPTTDPKASPPSSLERLNNEHRKALHEMWARRTPHLRDIKFDLDSSQWRPEDMKLLGDVLLRYESQFSKSKIDLGHCGSLPFKIKLQPDTAPIASRPYRTNPVIAQQVDSIVDTSLAAGITMRSTSSRASPLVVVVPKLDGSIRITANYEKLNAASIVATCLPPRKEEVLDSHWLLAWKMASWFSLLSLLTITSTAPPSQTRHRPPQGSACLPGPNYLCTEAHIARSLFSWSVPIC